MLRKAFLTILSVLGSVILSQAALAAKPIIDQNCYQQILDNLVVSKRDIISYKKNFQGLAARRFG